jgi:anti-sigma factor (TIGR02949 family)
MAPAALWALESDPLPEARVMEPLPRPAVEELDCRSFLSRLPDLLDREVEAVEEPRLQAHLDHCAHCLATYRFERSLLDELKTSFGQASIPSGLERQVLSLIERQIDGSSG